MNTDGSASFAGLLSGPAIWVAGLVLVLAVVLILVARFGNLGLREGAAWKYTAEIDHLRKLFGAESYDEAAAFVAPLLRKPDISAEFYDVAAIIAERRGRPAEAARTWRAMQRRYPTLAWGHMRTARLLLREGRVKQAHQVLARARKIVETPGVLVAVLAEAAQAERNWDEAIRLWAELRAAAPGEVDGYLHARTCLLAVGRPAEAEALLADIAVRMPAHPAVRQALAAAEKEKAAGGPATAPAPGSARG